MTRRNGGLDRDVAARLLALRPRGYSPELSQSETAELRRLLVELAGSVGIDLTRPSLPRFGKGESILEATARVLPLPHVLEAVETNRARTRLLDEARAEVDGLRSELNELQVGERVRRRDELDGGRLPGLPPAQHAARAAELSASLLLIEHPPYDVVPPAEVDLAVMWAALRPGDYVPAILYMLAVGDRLAVLDPSSKRTQTRAQLAIDTARRLTNVAGDRSDEPQLAEALYPISTWVRPFSRHAQLVEEALERDSEPVA